MTARSVWPWLCLLCVGCQVAAPLETSVENPSARQLWLMGQAAMQQGQPDQAISCYQQSLTADPSFTRNHLSLAAAFVEKGEETEACPHFAKYLAAHPEHWSIREYYAELLFKLKRNGEARAEFERLVADAQDAGPGGSRELIHGHTRLMEIAEAAADRYEEHLQRGIGLFLLARERAALPDDAGELTAEGLLCKAAGELTAARLERPHEARPNWYLYEVWSRLGQRQPALCCLHRADEAAPFSNLTAAEKRGLQLASRSCLAEGLRK